MSYGSKALGPYQLYVDVLMEMERRSPGAGFAAEAFHTNERARARGLLEMLATSGIDIHEGVDKALVERERHHARVAECFHVAWMAFFGLQRVHPSGNACSFSATVGVEHGRLRSDEQPFRTGYTEQFGSTDINSYVSPDAIEWLLLEVTGGLTGPTRVATRCSPPTYVQRA